MRKESRKSLGEEPTASANRGAPEESQEKESHMAHLGKAMRTEPGAFDQKIDLWGRLIFGFGGLIIGIVGLLFGYLAGVRQQKQSQELNNQQLELTRETEEKRLEFSNSQLNLQKAQFAASLINSVLKGSETERLLALVALEGVDKYLWEKYSEILARYDSDPAVRRQVIEGLGKKGEGTVRQTLITIQEQGKTPADRVEAKRAEANLTSRLKENLHRAKAFFDIGQWKSAADYFYEASKYVDKTQVDGSKLILARSHYEHGGYQEAAVAFNNLFSKL
ncbi:MAG: hypothetical protein AUJ04_03365 [Acidobacteria bacterium 13_1_40CM_3_55_6]|nr:MAG: hypothetical protein AUJ04_03365 [Acidobacteria bacterium 13_1_40CM_3_55_6]